MRDRFGMQNQIACMWALSNGTILTPQQLLAVYAGKHTISIIFIILPHHPLETAQHVLPKAFQMRPGPGQLLQLSPTATK